MPQLPPSDRPPAQLAGKIVMWSAVSTLAVCCLYFIALLIKLVVEVGIAISHL